MIAVAAGQSLQESSRHSRETLTVLLQVAGGHQLHRGEVTVPTGACTVSLRSADSV